MFWKGDASGLFSVKAFCARVEDKWFQEIGWPVPRRLRVVLPAKVALFLWQVQQNKVGSKANLMSRGIDLADEGTCSLGALMFDFASGG